VFSVGQREQIRAQILGRARSDPLIAGAAVTGSGAKREEDRWSDIDLFFGVVEGVGTREALEEWSEFFYRVLGALHHFDLDAPPAIYRGWLLPGCLEVDVGLSPVGAFGPLGPNFRIVFGETVDVPTDAPDDSEHLIGLAWHHTLHARSSIERDKLWQAEYWISAIRDHTLTLACLRLGLPAAYAKGADRLPAEITADLAASLVRSLDGAELNRALRAATIALSRELGRSDPDVAARLEDPLMELGGISPPSPNQ
jgi:hypothetical protein